jgi:hypothetical protein
LNSDLGFWAQVFESNLMFPAEEEGFNVIEFSVSEKEPIFTEKTSWLISLNSDSNITNIVNISSLGVRESDTFKAESICVCYRVGF